MTQENSTEQSWDTPGRDDGEPQDVCRKARTELISALGGCRERHAGWGRNVDLDFERRHRLPTLGPHPNLVGLDRDVLGNHGQDLLPKPRNQVRVARPRALMRQKNLKPLARYRSRAAAGEETEQPHAALRPNSLPKRPFRSLGTDIATASPLSRRAASKYAR